MASKKIIFFPDSLHDNSTKLKVELKKIYQCFQSSNPDEYGQAFHQSGKFVLVFSDAQVALRFLQERNEELKILKFKTFVFLNKAGRFSDKSQSLLDKYKILVFYPTQLYELMANIESYFSHNDVDDDALELKFSANEDK